MTRRSLGTALNSAGFGVMSGRERVCIVFPSAADDGSDFVAVSPTPVTERRPAAGADC